MPSKQNQLVRDFHTAFKAPVADKPYLIPEERSALRIKLIREELEEFEEAVENGDLVEIADALTDLLVVVHGSFAEYGLDDDPLFQEVQDSNMSKLGEDGEPIISDGTDGFPLGKILKGPNYFKPNLSKIVQEQINA